MKLVNFKRSILILFCCALAFNSQANPKQKPVSLKKHTSLVVHIPPGMGTRFVLPFLINETDKVAPFSMLITNPNFKHQIGKVANGFSVYVPNNVPVGEKSNLFFNIAGYEVAAELVATSNEKKHIETYFFNLDKKEEQKFLADIIQQTRKQLKSEFNERYKNLDKAVDDKLLLKLAEVSLREPKTKNVKEEKEFLLPNGDKIEMYIDEILVYGKYTIIPFEMSLRSRTEGVAVSNIRVFNRNFSTKIQRPIDGPYYFPKRIEPGNSMTGRFVTMTGNINLEDEIVFKIKVDDDTYEMVW